METDLRYPLHYPAGWQRSKYREKSNFNQKNTRTFAEARDELLRQLSLPKNSAVLRPYPQGWGVVKRSATEGSIQQWLCDCHCDCLKLCWNDQR